MVRSPPRPCRAAFRAFCVDEGDDVLDGLAREAKFAEIASAAVQEYAHLVAKEGRVGGIEPWHVVTRSDDDAAEADNKLIRRVCGVNVDNSRAARVALALPELQPVVSEFPDLVKHLQRLPGSLCFRSCVGEICAMCEEVMQRRRAGQPGWHPARCLSLLEVNGFRRWMLQKDAAAVAGDELEFTIDVQDPPVRAALPRGRGPYLGYAQLREQGSCQGSVVIPTSSKSREVLQSCTVLGCTYIGQYKAEMRRHHVIHHLSLALEAIPEPAVLPSAPAPPPPLQPNIYAGAQPKLRPKRPCPGQVLAEEWLCDLPDAQVDDVPCGADDGLDALFADPEVCARVMRIPVMRCFCRPLRAARHLKVLPQPLMPSGHHHPRIPMVVLHWMLAGLQRWFLLRSVPGALSRRRLEMCRLKWSLVLFCPNGG